jgi:hypothetical protein
MCAQVEFLDDIFHSIAKTPLRMSEDSSLLVSEQQLMELHQVSVVCVCVCARGLYVSGLYASK